MTWRDNHFTGDFTTLKLPVDNGITGAFINVNDIVAKARDPGLYGVERVDLRGKYLAPLDGTLHPLSTMGLAAAQILYPNIGLMSSTNLSTFAQDTAAWLQAEYDLRTGASGGMISLAEGGLMVVTSTLWMQNADRVWFYGTRGNQLLTSGTGTDPAIRISQAHSVGAPLRAMSLFAKDTSVYTPATAGAAFTGYRAGATAIMIDECQGVDIEYVGWNGYDESTHFGDDTFGVCFKNSGGGGNNYGLIWKALPTGLNSMERLRFTSGPLANNNYGFYIDAVYGPNSDGTYFSQGGSWFIDDAAIDYNAVMQGVYRSVPVGGENYPEAGLTLTNSYSETAAAISGTSKCRFYVQGAASFIGNQFYENSSATPPGIVEIADNTACSFIGNKTNAPQSCALGWSGTSATKYVTGTGNFVTPIYASAILLQDGNGTLLEASAQRDIQAPIIFNEPYDADWVGFYNQEIILDFFDSSKVTFSPPSDSIFAYPNGYRMQLRCINANNAVITARSGVTIDFFSADGTGHFLNGKTATLKKSSSNHWIAMIGS